MNIKTTYLYLAVTVFLNMSAIAVENFPGEAPTINRQVRNLGMGNVGVAIEGSHDSSPFYNPAGLNDLEKGRFQFLSPTFVLSKNAVDLIGDIKDLKDDLDSAASDPDKTRVFNEFVQNNSGKFRYIRFSMDVFNYVRKNFAAGLVIDERLSLSVRQAGSNPQFNLRNLGDAAFYVSGAHDFWEKLLQVGVTIRPTVRFAINEQDEIVDYSDIGDDANGDLKLTGQLENIKERRFGMGVDLGLKSNLAFSLWKDAKWYQLLKPAVGFTWQDIGSPDFGLAPSNGQTMNLGVAVHPDLWKLKNVVALDLREINEERPFLTKVHFGLESKLPWIVAVRAGVSQGYLTAGATFDLWVLKLDAAIYHEEVGVTSRTDGNLRWAAKISFNI
ncbi:MAG: hypothetical protein KDD48_01225 [Bdellovibrionales bacterium]|nr:hypothetical protein [Bdellovibrionales bacterium]